MDFTPIRHEDLDEIRKFQPEGWSDIIPDITFYVDSDFCSPIKLGENGNIVGIGTMIYHQDSSWMAHIIVETEHRNKGIGLKIVEKLIADTDEKRAKSILLIATDLGIPVYKKAGFRTVTEYVAFQRKEPWKGFPVSENIVHFEEKYRKMILGLDKRISGENREKTLSQHLPTSKLFVRDGKVYGVYVPDLVEGPILGETSEAGIELMKLKYATVDKGVLPSDNPEGIKFLQANGFAEIRRMPRMLLGEDLNWQPRKLFSRIGGNFG